MIHHHLILRGKILSSLFFRGEMIFIKCLGVFSLLFHQSFFFAVPLFTYKSSYWLRQLFQQSRNHKSTAKFCPFFFFFGLWFAKLPNNKKKWRNCSCCCCANNNRVWFVSIVTTCVIQAIRYDYVYRRKTGTFDDGRKCVCVFRFVFPSSLEKWHSRLLFHFILLFVVWGWEYYYGRRKR